MINSTMRLSLGTFSLAAVCLGWIALHRIDKMPRVDCCGCTFRKRFVDDLLEESNDSMKSTKKAITLQSLTPKTSQIGVGNV